MAEFYSTNSKSLNIGKMLWHALKYVAFEISLFGQKRELSVEASERGIYDSLQKCIVLNIFFNGLFPGSFWGWSGMWWAKYDQTSAIGAC